MRKSKKMIGFLSCMLTISFITVPAYAHCGGGYGYQQQNYPVCDIEDCNTTYCHDHDGVTYQGHSLYDGHDHHQLCNVSDCSITTVHTHDDVTYMGHHIGDGHSYHNQGRGCHGSRHHY